jgi:hypothetical protein
MHNFAFGSVLAIMLMVGVGTSVFLSVRLLNARAV